MASPRLAPLVLLLATGEVAATPCAVPATASELEGNLADAQGALEAFEPEAAERLAERADAAMPCLVDTIDRDAVTAFFRLRGITAALGDRRAEARALLSAARALAPEATLGDDLGPVIAEEWNAARLPPDLGTVQLEAPAKGHLRVDGVETTEAPLGRPFVLQWVDGSGAVGFSGVLDGLPEVAPYPVREVRGAGAEAPVDDAHVGFRFVAGGGPSAAFGERLVAPGPDGDDLEELPAKVALQVEVGLEVRRGLGWGRAALGVGPTFTGGYLYSDADEEWHRMSAALLAFADGGVCGEDWRAGLRVGAAWPGRIPVRALGAYTVAPGLDLEVDLGLNVATARPAEPAGGVRVLWVTSL